MHYYRTKNESVKFDVLLQDEIPSALLSADNGNMRPLRMLHLATTDTAYKKYGWVIPYTPYLKRYFVKTKDNEIIEMYALTKADIKRAIGKSISEIVEAMPYRVLQKTKAKLKTRLRKEITMEEIFNESM